MQANVRYGVSFAEGRGNTEWAEVRLENGVTATFDYNGPSVRGSFGPNKYGEVTSLAAYKEAKAMCLGAWALAKAARPVKPHKAVISGYWDGLPYWDNQDGKGESAEWNGCINGI